MLIEKPLILITNDDGDFAKGIAVLTELMTQLGEVVVVAPDGPRSAQSNALTVTQPIRFHLLEEHDGLTRYSCSGTPTDCVKLAINEIVPRKPDLLVSGINHGSNAAVNVIYSGTMGAVLEGCENGIPSVGFSICDYAPDADFSAFAPYIVEIARKVLANGLDHGICLNVNAPSGPIKGMKVARQCDGRWVKEIVKKTDPRDRAYYWLTGEFENHEPESTDTDEWALANGLVSVVPTKIDMTSHEQLSKIANLLK